MRIFKKKETRELLGITGTGTEQDPYLLKSKENIEYSLDEKSYFFDRVLIEGSKEFKMIEDCDLTYLTLFINYCKNFTLENCTIESIQTRHSSKLKFKNSTIRKKGYFYDSGDIEFENCTVSFLSLELSRNVRFNNCVIDDFKIENSQGIVFEKCQLPPNATLENVLNPPLQVGPKKDMFPVQISRGLFVFFVIIGIILGFITNFLIGIGFAVALSLMPAWFYLDSRKGDRNAFDRIKFTLEKIKTYDPNRII